MFFFLKKKDDDGERRRKLAENLKKLRDQNIPVYYDPIERQKKYDEHYQKIMTTRKFQTRKVFVITIILVGFMYFLIVATKKNFKENYTDINDLSFYLNIDYRWSAVDDDFENFLFFITLSIKENLSNEHEVNLNNNVVFDLTLFDKDGNKVFDQQFAKGIKINISKENSLILKSIPISKLIKESVQQVEFATETHLSKMKI